MIDNALLGENSTEFSENIGKKIENLVFLELSRRASLAEHEFIFYWQDHAGKEVDFIVKNTKTITKLIQVSYSLSQINTKEREVKALITASKQLRCDNLNIITMDEDGEEIIDGKTIKIISLNKFLLS